MYFVEKANMSHCTGSPEESFVLGIPINSIVLADVYLPYNRSLRLAPLPVLVAPNDNIWDKAPKKDFTQKLECHPFLFF